METASAAREEALREEEAVRRARARGRARERERLVRGGSDASVRASAEDGGTAQSTGPHPYAIGPRGHGVGGRGLGHPRGGPRKATSSVEMDAVEASHLALVVDGAALTMIWEDGAARAQFLELACMCKSVIACRVSPAQKAQLVKLVKESVRRKPMTLAIGDGANDVAMIQTADVGIGISGREGMQAVNSSDFAIAQFRFLKRLLLVHGRWSYRRICKVLLYSFFKNVVITVTLFYFTFFTGVSGTSLYESIVYSGFNFFLGLPIIAVGIFDRDLSEATALAHPEVYVSGRLNLNLNVRRLLSWIGSALVHGSLVFWVPFMAYAYGCWAENGRTDGLYVFGTTVYTAMILAMNWRVCLETSTWTWVNALVVTVSVLGFFGFLALYSHVLWFAPEFYQVADHAFARPLFWLLPLLVVAAGAVFDLAAEVIRLQYFPNFIDECIERDARKLPWPVPTAPGAGRLERNASYTRFGTNTLVLSLQDMNRLTHMSPQAAARLGVQDTSDPRARHHGFAFAGGAEERRDSPHSGSSSPRGFWRSGRSTSAGTDPGARAASRRAPHVLASHMRNASTGRGIASGGPAPVSSLGASSALNPAHFSQLGQARELK